MSKKILLCFCFCFGLTAARAQYRIDHWTADDGLPQNSVYSLVQTRDGYLWLATVDGLARFDGVRFTVFNKSNSPGISNNRFTALFEDFQGDLWAGTEESGVGRFRGGRFELFDAGGGALRTVYWIMADADDRGVIFVNNLFQTFHFSGGKFSPLEAAAKNSTTLQAARSTGVKIVCRNNAENNVSECLVGGQWISFPLPDASPQKKFVSVARGVNITVSAQETNGNVWLITTDGRVVRAENGSVTKVFDERDGLPKYPLCLMTGARFALVAKDADGSLWLIDLPSMRKELLLKKDAVPPPFEREEILSTYADGEGNLWFGTIRDGLFRARKQTVTAYSEAEGIAVKNVYPIYQDRAGTIWVGTTVGATGGLYKYENGAFALVESTRNLIVSAIGEDPLGRLLISDGGSLYVQEASNRFVPFENEKISSADFIYAIHADRAGALWIGGGGGLLRFKDGVSTRFAIADGLAGNDVKVIVEARGGGLWIGTYDGLTRFENGKLTSWREANDLPSRTVRALYEDQDGALWIGSYDGGLARFKDGKFTRYNTKTGLPNDGAFQILEDDNRNFWISSNRGIYRVKKDELNDFADGKIRSINAVAYAKADGMLNAECNGGRSPAGIKTRDGRLWFPTQDGVAMIDPREIKINSQPPPVVIESVKVDNNDLKFENSDFESGDEESKIQIEPAQQNFEIGYTALSFINSENLRFRYKLEGLDDDWIDAGTRRSAYFSHVPPGEFTFRVIAANSDGVWNEMGARLKVTVKPPFYRTWAFLLASAAIGLLVVYAIYRRRVGGLERARHLQEEFSRRLINANESERRRIAGELHDSIGQSLAMIKNRALLSAESAKDENTRKQLELITAQATQTIGEVREISYALRPYLLDNLGLTKAVKSLLDNISETSELAIDMELDDVDNIFDREAEMSIYRTIQESLSNILKHAEASEAQVFIKKSARNLTVLISDDGKGFDMHAVEARDAGKGGFGLLGIAERVKMLSGTQEIESKAGDGTTILIKIPVPVAETRTK